LSFHTGKTKLCANGLGAGAMPPPAARGASGMTFCQLKRMNPTPMKTMWAPWRIEYILADKQDGLRVLQGPVRAG